MKQLLRRLSRVASDTSSMENRPLREGEKIVRRRRGEAVAAQGHVPMYVGDEMVRFEVRTELLSRPTFAELLRWSAQEYGYEQRGPLRIPCSVHLFRHVLRSLLASDSLSPEAEEELLRVATDEDFCSAVVWAVDCTGSYNGTADVATKVPSLSH